MEKRSLYTKTPESQRLKLIAANLAEYDTQTHDLRWITKSQALHAEEERARSLAALHHAVDMAFHKTKPRLGPLSPGCAICGAGAWSCLFINGKCNCRCFYCPTAQNEISIPTTNRIPFDKPSDYAAYVQFFDFKGVSISGGEPLMTLDRTLSHIKAVRRKMGDDLHLWMYTNGTLLSRETVLKLKDCGLNEIRFDISARDYDLDKLKLAAGHIPVVTVEIPAIPEDLEKMAGLLSVMHDAGVNHLNLHQLRMTPHNLLNLKNRNYTFLHGDKVTVLESEMTALKLMAASIENGTKLPINYCSYVYKHRFQGAAARRRSAHFIVKDHESVTENGFIRTMSLAGDPQVLQKQADRFTDQGVNPIHWSLSGKKDRLLFHEQLWPRIDFAACELQLGYAEAVLSPYVSYRHAFKEIRLNPAKKIIIEKQAHSAPLLLNHEQREAFEKSVIFRVPETMIQEEVVDQPFASLEFITPGLQEYF